MSKTNNKRLKPPYDPDWSELSGQQDRHPQITTKEWDMIFSTRQFRPGTELVVREEIGVALLGFIRLNSGYSNVEEYRSRITDLMAEVSIASRRAQELEKFNYQRLLMLTAVLDADPRYPHNVLTEKPLKEFQVASHRLQQQLRDVILGLDTHERELKNFDVYWLVRALNRIVLKHSDGGRLTRGETDRKGKGNDLFFVSTIMKIACDETGRTVDTGTIKTAIRNLKSIPS